jgi:hypothetical protein
MRLTIDIPEELDKTLTMICRELRISKEDFVKRIILKATGWE